MAKRRGNGEGSIRKRADGRWEGRYTAGHDDTGKAIVRNVLGKTQAEVREKLKTAIKDTEGVDIKRTEQYTLTEWMRLWFENYSKPVIRPATADYYQNYMENHILPNIGEIPLKKLTSLDVQKMYNKTKTSGRVQRFQNMTDLSVSNRMVRGIHMLLHQCLDHAVKEKLIPINPTNGCKVPKNEKSEMKVIPPEKVGAYLKAAEEYGVLPMLYLELSSGLRRGELLALLWSDLDIENCTVSVTKQVNARNGELVVSTPKTPNSIRMVAIPRQAVDLLMQEHEKHPDNPYMFPSPVTGTMYHPCTAGRIHRKLLKMAGIEHIRFHDLRHTFATVALQNGVDIKTLSGMLGHYSAGFTLDTYTHISEKMQRDAAEKMGGFMGKMVQSPELQPMT